MLISLVVMIICSILALNKDKPYYNMLNSLGATQQFQQQF